MDRSDRWISSALLLVDFNPENGGHIVYTRADRSADLHFRANMINTFDAKAAGCTASAFEDSNRHTDSCNGVSKSLSSHNHPSQGMGSLLGSIQAFLKGILGSGKVLGADVEDASADKLGMEKPVRDASLARVPLLAYKDPRLERAFTLWHARHRWQVSHLY